MPKKDEIKPVCCKCGKDAEYYNFKNHFEQVGWKWFHDFKGGRKNRNSMVSIKWNCPECVKGIIESNKKYHVEKKTIQETYNDRSRLIDPENLEVVYLDAKEAKKHFNKISALWEEVVIEYGIRWEHTSKYLDAMNEFLKMWKI